MEREDSTMRIATLTLIASFASSALLAAPALAGDDKKNYAGAFCFDREPVASRISSDVAGVAYNTVADEVMFVCPAVKDYVNIDAARAYVIDERTDAAVVCKLRTIDQTLDTHVASASTGVAQHGGTPVALLFGGLAASSFSTYVLSCRVPGESSTGLQSAIVSYQIDENE
jgi:hypothetical protein